ncbi:hypothetical protein QWI29_21990 [Mycolicibacterium neoaurum]|uniref:hypothetical protein n=1 Tax=Mycolicibacterium neoaurum TaxID=1795 RepID=UPI002672DECD|nr:hypothetical protein [Mycolicibacterium neoaurum]MDO3402720.1 hypothetical protein [Mycolicibacterium neoaurum]
MIDSRPVPLLVGLGLAMAFQTAWLIGAIRAGNRDRAFSLPLVCTFLWFAHDFGYVVRLPHWIATYDHWWVYLFWLGMLSALVLEVFFFAQILQFGRAEIAPTLSQNGFRLLIAAGATGAVIGWEYLRVLFGDPLYLASSSLTLLSYALFGPALLLRRHGRRGQTLFMWGNFTAMTATWWVTTCVFLAPIFLSWQYVAVGVFTFAVGVAMIALLRRDDQWPTVSADHPRGGSVSTAFGEFRI